MNRLPVLLLSAVLAAAPLAAANAQDRGQSDRSAPREPRIISPMEARSIAQSRAGDARYMSYTVDSSGRYVFTFQQNGRVFYIEVNGAR